MINGLKIKMIIQISLTLLLAASVISFQDEDEGNKTARKHYGLSFHSKCTDYVKSFTCMTTCKSIGFQVFRMDFRCKCSCHGLKTTTILPFYKWRTNGTTKALPQTHSPYLYHVAGTLSPARTASTEETTTTASNVTCAPPENINLNATNDNTTSVDDESDTTGDAMNTTDTSDTGADGNATTADGEDTTTGVDATTADGEVTTTGVDATTDAAAVDGGATTTAAEGDAPDAAPEDAPAAED